MQRTADFHHQIVHTRFSQTARVLDNAAALDAAVDVLDTNPATRDPPIGRFLRPRELPTRGFFTGMMISTWSSVNAKKPRSWSNRLPAGKG